MYIVELSKKLRVRHFIKSNYFLYFIPNNYKKKKKNWGWACVGSAHVVGSCALLCNQFDFLLTRFRSVPMFWFSIKKIYSAKKKKKDLEAL